MHSKPLFAECIEAWRYGPVVPVVYQTYKHFWFDTIKIDEPERLPLEEVERSSIDMVMEYCGQMSSLTLVNKTHSEKPWRDNYKEGENNIIPIEDIESFFKATLEFAN